MMKIYISAFIVFMSVSQMSNAQDDLKDKSYLKSGSSIPEVPTIQLELDGKLPYTSLKRALLNKDKATRLNLSYQGLLVFPAEILQLKNLESLDLSSNNIQQIPAGISQLKNLKSLILNGNQLQSLPASIGELSNLEILFVHYNKTSFVLPESIVKLKNLKKNMVFRPGTSSRFLLEDDQSGRCQTLVVQHKINSFRYQEFYTFKRDLL